MRDQDGDSGWFELIKTIRAEHGVGILEAEKVAVQDPTRRRWLERRINSDRKCRKLALSDIKQNGDDSLVCWQGDRLVVRAEIYAQYE